MFKNQKTSLKIIVCSIFAALSAIFDLFVSIRVSSMYKISLYPIPLILIGLLYGKWYGLLSGLVVGFLDQLLGPYGFSITTPFWLLAFMAWGFFSGLFKKLFEKSQYVAIFFGVLCACLGANTCNTLAMFMDSLLIKDSYYTLSVILSQLPMRYLFLLVDIVLYSVLLVAITNVMDIVFNQQH